MGCHNTSTKTREQVKGDLENVLKNALKRKLSKDYPYVRAPESGDIEDCLYALATARFKSLYQYDYTNNSKPPDRSQKANPRSINRLISLDNDNQRDELIRKYVDSGLLSGIDLPLWMKSVTRSDLISVVRDLTGKPYQNDWMYGEYVQNYDPAALDHDSMKCQSIIIYANGTLAEDALKESIHIFYFLGVYYEIDSPTAQARAEVQQRAFTSAQNLKMGARITDENGLKIVLKDYTSSVFRDNFRFNYNSSPPDFPNTGSATLLVRNQQLSYFQTRSKSNFESYVEQEIMQGLHIPIDSVKRGITNDIEHLFQAAFHDSKTGSWNYLTLDHTYGVNAATIQPVQADGILAYWWDHKTVTLRQGGYPVDVSVDVIYVYFLGMAYELRTDLVGLDLFKKLCKNLLKTADDADHGDVDKWEKDIMASAAARFKTNFGYAYDTEPPGKKPNTSFKFKSQLLEFSSLPTPEDVKEKIDYEIFVRNDTGFTHVGTQIYDKLVEAISYRAGPKTPKDNGLWYDNYHEPRLTFTGADGAPRSVQENAGYLFAWGKVTGDRTGADTQEKFYITWLASVYQLPEVNHDDDV